MIDFRTISLAGHPLAHKTVTGVSGRPSVLETAGRHFNTQDVHRARGGRKAGNMVRAEIVEENCEFHFKRGSGIL